MAAPNAPGFEGHHAITEKLLGIGCDPDAAHSVFKVLKNSNVGDRCF